MRSLHSNVPVVDTINQKKAILENSNIRGENMTPSDAIGIAEGYIEGNEAEAWQFLIDSGLCWQLQGWFGRTAMHLIDEGLCHYPQKNTDPDHCDVCECTPCDCNWGTDQ